MNRTDILHYLSGAKDEELFAAAHAEKLRVFGKDVYLRGIIEFSNHCKNQCLYCGLRAPNKEAGRYRLSIENIITLASGLPELGFGTVVLQSGDDYHYSTDDIANIVSTIKSSTNLAITLSLGDRGLDEFRAWREAGADRYLLKLETTNTKLYEKCRPNESLKDRFQRIEALQQLGYEVGSGIITGLPDMTNETLADDILKLTELRLDMLAAGPFIPHPQTPFKDMDNGTTQDAFRVSALLRLLNPEANIPATSALDALEQDGRKKGLQRGCNVIMPSFTPEEVRANYKIYPGKNTFSAGAVENARLVQEMIRNMGFIPYAGQGPSKRKNRSKG
ncbi:MAG: [FeFe] hydrogenase H-cluster radical SAM maturase HydE [Desulfovibrio sp.]